MVEPQGLAAEDRADWRLGFALLLRLLSETRIAAGMDRDALDTIGSANTAMMAVVDGATGAGAEARRQMRQASKRVRRMTMGLGPVPDGAPLMAAASRPGPRP